MPLPGDLAGRCAVVTGAARGIGRAVAEHLLHAGAQVIAVDKDEPALKELFDGKPGCAWIAHDMAMGDEYFGGGAVSNGTVLAERVLNAARERLFALPSLLVHNAADSTQHGFLDLMEEEHDRIYRVIVRTPRSLTRQLVSALLQVRESQPDTAPPSGAILWVGSLHCSVPARRPHYSSSKAAAVMLAKELALELGPHRIRVNVISPGWVRTDPDPTSQTQRAKEEKLVPRIPLRRPGEPQDVARLALLLLSDQCSGYVTGVHIPVDGGLRLGARIPPPRRDQDPTKEAVAFPSQSPSPAASRDAVLSSPMRPAASA